MIFDQTNKVIIATLNKSEAKAFISFLHSEIVRHQRDIVEAEVLINKVKEKFGWK